MFYTMTLNPSLDYHMTLPGLQPGALHRTGETRLVPGGKGINVALVLTRLDVPCRALGLVAGATGRMLEDLLAETGLDCAFTPTDGLTRINVKVHAGEETELNASGPCPDGAAIDRLCAAVDALAPGDGFVLSGAAPAGTDDSLIRLLLERAGARGAALVADCTGSALRTALTCRPLLVKPNRDELDALFDAPASDLDTVAARAHTLRREGARYVLVSLGGEGALLACPDGTTLEAAAPRGTVISTVGAGDSMVAGFLAAWSAGADDAACLAHAVAAGSASAFSPWLADAPGLDRLLPAIRVHAR